MPETEIEIVEQGVSRKFLIRGDIPVVAASAPMADKDRCDLLIKLSAECAARSRHHDTVRASITVGLITFTSVAFVLFAAVAVNLPSSSGVLFLISYFVEIFGLFALFFSFLRQIYVRRWNRASIRYLTAAHALVQPEPIRRRRRLTRTGAVLVGTLTWILMAISMLGPGVLLYYAASNMP